MIDIGISVIVAVAVVVVVVVLWLIVTRGFMGNVGRDEMDAKDQHRNGLGDEDESKEGIPEFHILILSMLPSTFVYRNNQQLCSFGGRSQATKNNETRNI